MKEIGVGITLLPHAMREFHALGVTEELQRQGIINVESCFFNRFGQLIYKEPRGRLAGYALPERVGRAGDPYQWQVEKTAAALTDAVKAALPDLPAPEWTVTYQSRATPEAWLKPDTEVEVERAARAGQAVVVVPIAFVSEHSETLVELDVDYAELAARAGAAAYRRVPAVAAAPDFIAGLAELTRRALVGEAAVSSQFNGRICPAGCSGCPNLRR